MIDTALRRHVLAAQAAFVAIVVVVLAGVWLAAS